MGKIMDGPSEEGLALNGMCLSFNPPNATFEGIEANDGALTKSGLASNVTSLCHTAIATGWFDQRFTCLKAWKNLLKNSPRNLPRK